MLRLIAVVLFLGAVVCAQAPAPRTQPAVPAPAAAKAQAPSPEAEQIAGQFGPAFKATPGYPVLTPDLDGDGTPDTVVVATGENPLIDEAEYHYKVVDPYNAYYGFADPRLTAQFAIPKQEKPHHLLVVLSRRGAPAKYVLVNVPFEKLGVTRVLAKKKPVTAISAEELTGMRSAVYWDGKKWKWMDVGIE